MMHDACEYKIPTYLRAYQKPLEPIRGENMWPVSEGDAVLPPKLRKMPGRPKKKRRREVNEQPIKTKMSKLGGTVTCHVCRGKGHNARSKTCPGRTSSSSQRTAVSIAQSRSAVTASVATESISATNIVTASVAQSSCAGSTGAAAINSRYVSPFHRDCRPKSKPKKRIGLTGLGLYINPVTERSILNPGTSMSRVIDRGSQSINPRNPSRNDGTGGGTGGA